MSANENRAIITGIMTALAEGDGRPFAEAMAEDFTWTIQGSGPWARTWRGRQAVREQLIAPLFAQFATRYRNLADRIVADGDVVVVECHGEVATTAGEPYNNAYCWVIRMADGKMAALTEYMDTALAERALVPPG